MYGIDLGKPLKIDLKLSTKLFLPRVSKLFYDLVRFMFNKQ